MTRKILVIAASAATLAIPTLIPASSGATSGEIHCKFQRRELATSPHHAFWEQRLRECLAREGGG